MAKKFVYMFSETTKDMRNLVGGKGCNLGEMTQLGLPIPQGFTVTTEGCTQYYKDGKKIKKAIIEEIFASLKKLEKITGKKLGDKKNPLLLSIRSGARVSMPGMMDTILNLGINDEVCKGLAEKTNNPHFAYDSYRRFIKMFSDVAVGLDANLFEDALTRKRKARKVKQDYELTAQDFKELAEEYKQIYKKETKKDFPTDPKEQLITAVEAVFDSWNTPRAIYYRRMNSIPHEWGTAVNVQEMVYGNMGDTSGTGVAFSRNPANGDNDVFGEYLMNAQGEDVVAGIRTPDEIHTLKVKMPKVYNEFHKLITGLEKHFKDMQDVEFTIENGKLFFLQTRSGKRTGQAALKIAVDMVKEGLITEKEALLKVEPKHLDAVLHLQFDQSELKKAKPMTKGLPASPGAATGKAAFSVSEVVKFAEEGYKSILVRTETSPEDIEGMNVSEGFLTARGGMTSHAAVVARGMGKVCVASAQNLEVNEKTGVAKVGNLSFKRGDFISIDGTTGFVYDKAIKTIPASIQGDFATLMGWADKYRKLGIRANADTPKDVKQAIDFGAEGVGLVRTEHMFFAADRIKAIRKFIVAQNSEQREKALAKIQPMQQGDFEEILKTLEGKPMTVRYLDPPLHEFLPHDEKDIKALAKDLKMTVKALKTIIATKMEVNPMMGHRGVRLSISYPELAEMQTRALIGAYIKIQKQNPKWDLKPEIMIPLVGDKAELLYVKERVVKVADELIKKSGLNMKYDVGTMIEIPRATLLADEIAKEADFFSFGTNDLTQLTYGFSRDDAGYFLNDYYERQIFLDDPFQTVDQRGVGQLVEKATKLGRKTKKELKIGVCGEHGGDPRSIEFFNKVGLTYVSCSPYRVPIARLAAAQAAIKASK